MKHQDTFDMLVRCAVIGSRCPTRDQMGKGNEVSALARAGHIRLEVASHNWRTIHILTGPHAGKSTMPPPLRPDGKPPKPYLVIDANSLPPRATYAHKARQRPWKPGTPRP